MLADVGPTATSRAGARSWARLAKPQISPASQLLDLDSVGEIPVPANRLYRRGRALPRPRCTVWLKGPYSATLSTYRATEIVG